MEAQLVQNLETERKGERFTLIEPPLQPSAPVSPNRKLMIVLGFVLAAGAAVGLMLLLEQLDTRIRGRSHLVQLVGVPALAIVPVIEIEEDRAVRRRKFWILTAVAIMLAGAAVAFVHYFVMPLDVLILGLMRRMGV
jgi:succinoglycan biosynthesis transport protein ExoP